MANASMASHNFGSHKDCPFAPTAPVVEAFAASNEVLHLMFTLLIVVLGIREKLNSRINHMSI